MVQIKREQRRAVYEYLLNEGVIVVKKDFKLPQHASVPVKNLEVWMLLRSLKDKGLVDVVFSWQFYYYYLKNEGVQYLRDKLGIAEQVVPATFKKSDKVHEIEAEGGSKPRQRGAGRGRGSGGRGFGRGRRNEEGEKPAEEGQPQEQQQE